MKRLANLELPDLSTSCDVPRHCIEEFREKGHTVVRNLASPQEVAAYRPAILESAPRVRYDHRPLEERDTYGRAFVQMLNVWTRDERVQAFVFARRFANAAAVVLGVESVRLYHDQALFKEPGGGLTPWHQDQFYWPLDTPHTITLWMPLVPIEAPMGPMVFASGSQRLGNLGDFAIGDDSQAAFSRVIEEHGLPRGGARRGSTGPSLPTFWSPGSGPSRSYCWLTPCSASLSRCSTRFVRVWASGWWHSCSSARAPARRWPGTLAAAASDSRAACSSPAGCSA